MVKLGEATTTSYDNQFHFTCPIFLAEARMGDCMKVRDITWRGQVVEGRGGCQAMLSCGKCPVVAIIRAVNNRDYSGSYSREKRFGTLDADHLAHTNRVLARSDSLQRFSITAEELELIEAADERTHAAATKGAKRAAPEPIASRKMAPAMAHAPAKSETPPRTPETMPSTDGYAEAINRAVAEAAAPSRTAVPAPSPQPKEPPPVEARPAPAPTSAAPAGTAAPLTLIERARAARAARLAQETTA